MTPWHEVNGEIGGALLTSEVVTARKQAERRRDCLLQLTARLRDAPRDAAATALALLAEFVGASRVGWAEVDETEAQITVRHEHAGDTLSSAIASPAAVTFGAEMIEELRAGRTLVVEDSRPGPHSAFIPSHLRSLVAIPLLRDGRPRAMLYFGNRRPHEWTVYQARLAEEVAAHIWAVVEQTRLQDAMERTAEEFLALADGIPALCWMAEPDGSIYWYSQRCCQYTGLTSAEMQGPGWQLVHDPDVLPAIRERWRRAVATASPFEMTLPLRGSDGMFRPFLTRVAPVHGPDGAVRRWLGVNIDVHEAVEREAAVRWSEAALRESEARLRDTVEQLSARTADLSLANQQLVNEVAAREQTEAALLASEQRFRDFAELGADWLWETDPDDRFSYFSTREVFGTQTGEFIGKTRDQIGVVHHTSAALAGFTADMAARRPLHDNLISVTGEDGVVHHALANARPVFGADGRFHGYRGVGRDVTDRIEAERRINAALFALWQSEERFRQVVEYAPNAIMVVGATGTIEMINAQTEQMFGYQREELIARNIETLIPERHRHGHPALFRSFLADRSPRPMGTGRHLYAMRRDGSEFPTEIGLNPIETDDGLMVLATITDISDRHQKEARIQAALKEKEVPAERNPSPGQK